MPIYGKCQKTHFLSNPLFKHQLYTMPHTFYKHMATPTIGMYRFEYTQIKNKKIQQRNLGIT
jgi:hypothetical protein